MSEMKKIWQKKEVNLLKEVERFTVGDDYLIDMHLVKYDIMGSVAHAKMLHKIGILEDSELHSITQGLKSIYQDFKQGHFSIAYADEDVHTAVEKKLTEQIGEAGKKLHTARSRNDQVLTDMRLFCKEELLLFKLRLMETASVIVDFARKHEWVPMCGYTHMQRAMPSSVGQWAGAFAEELADILYLWDGVYQLSDMSPLGSGAGFGVSIDVDREYTANELGFSRVQNNPIYCQNSRGKIEVQFLNLLSQTALALNKIATDLVLFTTAEFAFFSASDSITTGSSIMPQKKNLDVMELLRGKTFQVLGLESAMKNLVTNLISGYHRDLQDTKRMLIQALSMVKEFLAVVEVTFSHITPDEKKLAEALDKTVFATDYAYMKVKEGVPFRQAYQEVGSNLKIIPDFDVLQNMREKQHRGATGNLGLEATAKRLSQERQNAQKAHEVYEAVANKLIGA